MRAYALLLTLTLLSLPPSGFTDEAAEVDAIDKVYANWRTAVESSDIPGYVASLHEDIRLLPPGAPAIVGSDAYAKFLIPVFETATYKIDVVQMPAITVRGDTAVAEYHYTIHVNLKDENVGVNEPGALTDSSTARYFDVLIKEEGQWRVWRHTWQTYEL